MFVVRLQKLKLFVAISNAVSSAILSHSITRENLCAIVGHDINISNILRSCSYSARVMCLQAPRVHMWYARVHSRKFCCSVATLVAKDRCSLTMLL